jgi:hypothetical protein
VRGDDHSGVTWLRMQIGGGGARHGVAGRARHLLHGHRDRR